MAVFWTSDLPFDWTVSVTGAPDPAGVRVTMSPSRCHFPPNVPEVGPPDEEIVNV